MRTQLRTSREDGKRSFIDRFGYSHGWPGVVTQYFRDRSRGSKLTDLKPRAMEPDGYDAMNVHYAKVVFSHNTLTEQIGHICEMLKVDIPPGDDRHYEADLEHCYRPELKYGKGPLLGKLSARVNKVRVAFTGIKHKLKAEVVAAVGSELALLDYRVHVYSIFNECLMNKSLHITFENCAGFQSYLKKKLDYFGKWHKYNEASKTRTAANFLSQQTWLNLRMTVCGFLQYAAYTHLPTVHLCFSFSGRLTTR